MNLLHHVVDGLLWAVQNPDAAAPPGVSGPMNTILGWAKWIVFSLGVLGLFIVGGSMALKHRRGESSELTGQLGMVLAGCVLAVSAVPIINALT